MNNQWLNDLRKKMEDHQEDVPEGLWDNIRDELFTGDKSDSMTGFISESGDPKEKRKASKIKIKPMLYRIGGIAAAIAILIIMGKKLFDPVDKKPIHEIKYTYTKTNNKIKSAVNQKENKIAVIQPDIRDNFIEKRNYLGNIEDRPSAKIYTEKNWKEIIQERKLNEVLIPEAQGINPLEKIFDHNKLLSLENNKVIESQHQTDDLPLEEKNDQTLDKLKLSKHHSKKSWMLGMLTGNASLGSKEQFPGYASLNGRTMSINDQIWSTNVEDNPLIEVLLANQDKDIEAKVRHKVPVTLGLSLYYTLGKRWGIGTGIDYTKLGTELQTGSNSNFIKSDQTIHYVGIPIHVNYNVIQKDGFTGYITGGALVEKAVAGNIKTKYIVNDEIKNETMESLETKPIQFSVNTGVGLQLKVIKNLGIYAEPGAAYHFKDNSQLNTVYKEKPLNFNIKFGVRVLIN